ncbi:hypothetical protein PRVXH_000770 [Proteinivorax hydrogeniformans]|uniref:Uncharacterized protein n=1 Tax=Proteinivorax hydrogeniformans TaxID=1826727 RepID=A0AAU8HVM3_9FIRM
MNKKISLMISLFVLTVIGLSIVKGSSLLLPWNVNAIIIGTITGISATSYGLYAVLCYLFPLTVVWIFFIEKAKTINWLATKRKLPLD